MSRVYTNATRGFTIVELIIAMAVASIVAISSIGIYTTVTSQMPMINTRNTLSTNLQNALNRINDDVRLSSNAGLYNLTADPNAPTTRNGYTDVPGPDVDTNDQYYWRMSFNRLLLNQTPIDASGNPLYDNAAYAAGKRNTIVYYVNNGALYRRIIAADYPTNAAKTNLCTRVATGGCSTSDIKIIDGLDPSLGDAAFTVTYYDKVGGVIKNTRSDGSGNTTPDYSGFPLTRSIGVKISLKSGTIVNNQTVSLANTMRMQFRSQPNVVPPTVVNPPVIPPTNGIGNPGLMVGPGGLRVGQSSVIGGNGGDIYVKGTVQLTGMFATIGSSSGPVNLNIANIGCGSGSSYPQVCGTEPITFGQSTAIYGNVCATGQTSTTSGGWLGGTIYPAGALNKGLIPGCVPPNVSLPVFDKGTFTSSMTNGPLSGSTGSCGIFGTKTWPAGTTYTGDVSVGQSCSATISGDTYITGNLSTGAFATIKVSESVGKKPPIIVVNGQINLGQSSSVQPNSFGTTPYFISFYSDVPLCSSSPSCTTIPPANIQSTINGPPAISCTMFSSLQGSAVYAYFGAVQIGQSCVVGAVAGQSVDTSAFATLLLNGQL